MYVGGSYLISPSLGSRLILFVISTYMVYLLASLTSVGNYLISAMRGLYWGIRLNNFPKKFRVEKDVTIFNPKCVSFGESCNIGKGAVFAPLGKGYPSRIIVGNRVHIGAMDRIASMNEVLIEDDVLFAAFVHITDHSHEFRNIGIPISQQGVFCKGPVCIKRGSWLAFGCHILSGVTVGECSIVAANAVVTKDVPPYTVVAGNPARIVKQYNFETNKWENIHRE